MCFHYPRRRVFPRIFHPTIFRFLLENLTAKTSSFGPIFFPETKKNVVIFLSNCQFFSVLHFLMNKLHFLRHWIFFSMKDEKSWNPLQQKNVNPRYWAPCSHNPDLWYWATQAYFLQSGLVQQSEGPIPMSNGIISKHQLYQRGDRHPHPCSKSLGLATNPSSTALSLKWPIFSNFSSILKCKSSKYFLHMVQVWQTERKDCRWKFLQSMAFLNFQKIF